MAAGLARHEDSVHILSGCSIEPLVDGWAAWLMVIDPVAAGFYRNHHVEMLESYLSSPERHRKAVADPRLAGGPFCDLPDMPYVQIAEWATWYRQVSAGPIQFAEEFGALLRRLACDRLPDGYVGLPLTLQGRLELRHDLSGAPVARALRGVTERPSTLGVAVWRDGRRRPSMFSTPRLSSDHRFTLAGGTPAQIAAVAGLHHIPAPREMAAAHAEVLGLALDSLFEPASTQPPPPRAMRFLGHASVAMPIGEGWLLTDPVPPATSRAARSLSDVRIVLVTHCHPDHFSIEALLPLLPQQPTVFVPAGSGAPIDPPAAPALRALGFREVIEVRPYDQVRLAGAVITALPFLGEHGSLPIDSKTVFHVATDSQRVVFAADATGLDPCVFCDLHTIDRTDALLIGMEPAGAPARWLYGPVLDKTLDGPRSGSELMRGATAEEVLALADALGTRIVRIYGTGAPGMEHIFGRSAANTPQVLAEVDRVRDLAHGKGIDLVVLDVPGQTIELRAVP
jgi:glyoxylase-like metal-dependent hydrolase (beta-lactamase superfamily II)